MKSTLRNRIGIGLLAGALALGSWFTYNYFSNRETERTAQPIVMQEASEFTRKSDGITLDKILESVPTPAKLQINLRANGLDRKIYEYSIFDQNGNIKQNPDFDRLLINTAQKKAYCLSGNKIVKEMDIDEIGPDLEPSAPFVQPDSKHYLRDNQRFWHVAYMDSRMNENSRDIPFWAGNSIIRMIDKNIGGSQRFNNDIYELRIGPTLHETGGEIIGYTAGCFGFKTDDIKFLHDKFKWMKPVYFTYDNSTQIIGKDGKVFVVVGENPYPNITSSGEIEFEPQGFFTGLKGANEDLKLLGVLSSIDEKITPTSAVYESDAFAQQRIIARRETPVPRATPTNYASARVTLAQNGFTYVRTKQVGRRSQDIFRYTVQQGGAPAAVIGKFNTADNRNGDFYSTLTHTGLTDVRGNEIISRNLSKGTDVYVKVTRRR